MGMDLTTVEKPKDVPGSYAKAHPDPGYYRFNVQGMASMVSLMSAAGVLSDEPSPKFPERPAPKDPKHGQLYDEVMGGNKEARAKLKADELRLIDAYVAEVRKLQKTRSASADKVPAYKFQSNDGWFVSPDECRLIARAMRNFATHVTSAQAKAANDASKRRDEQLYKAVDPSGAMVRLTQQTGMSVEELRTWMLDWADYNTLASFSGGYEVN